MTQSQTAIVALRDYMDRDDVKARLEQVLNKRAPQFAASILSVVGANNMLQKATPASIVSSAMVAATLDLPINSNLGFAYIVPYGGEAQFQMGYKGFIQLAIRSRQYQTISVTEVYDGQLVTSDPLRGDVFDWTKRDSDKVVGYVAYFRLTNGFEKQLFMTVEQLQEHGKKFSKSYGYDLRAGKKSSLWSTDFDSMAKKTVVKLLISKWGVMSTELIQAVEKDQSVDDGTGMRYADNETPKPDQTPLTDEEKAARKQEAADLAAKRKAEAAQEGEVVA